MLTDFQPWIDCWGLEPDGAPFETEFGSRLLPVRRGGEAAMLKIALHEEERRGGAVMAWRGGVGAARVFAFDAEAVVMERLDGSRSLAAMARGGGDDAACRALCETAALFHAPTAGPPPSGIIPLEWWFAALWPQAERAGGIYAEAALVARELLGSQGPPVVLHGDVHHDNILDGGARGWLAIDPKGLWGDRGYDYANLMCNPDASTAVAHLDARLEIAMEISGFSRERLLKWVLAYLGLSASWTLTSRGDPWQALRIAEAVRVRLGV